MKKSKKGIGTVCIVLLIFLVIFAVFSIISHLFYHRSNMATAAELLFRLQGIKKKFSDPQKCAEYIEERRNAGDYALNVKLSSDVVETDIDGNKVYILSNSESPVLTVLYLHGGAYINDPSVYHWKFCDKLVQRVNARVIFPIYPLTPAHTWEETYELVAEVYKDILSYSDRPVIIMGDSAGGGLAVAFCEYLNEIGLDQPDKLILLSPWLDVSMSNPLAAEYESADPMLSAYGLVEMGKCWAGDLDITDYRISPIFGDISCLDNVYLFVGTREIFYPDVTLFYSMFNAEGKSAVLYIGEGMNHVYPLYPIPEADDAMDIICDLIKD